jgi:hypothetical protein
VIPSTRLYPPAAPPPPVNPIRINFQPASASTYSGYLVDSGLAYGNRGNGQSYGWNATKTADVYDRGSFRSADQRYDTLIYMQRSPTPDSIWEIAVPNGSYTVHVVAGDASYISSVYRLSVEGVLTVNGTPTDTNRWIQGTSTVTVTDGRITIRSASGSVNNKICFLEITPN